MISSEQFGQFSGLEIGPNFGIYLRFHIKWPIFGSLKPPEISGKFRAPIEKIFGPKNPEILLILE